MKENFFPKKVLLGLQEGDCNLSCPKCYTHGENAPTLSDRKTGVMNFEKFIALCEELAPYSPRVTPQTWDEPLLTPNILKYLKILKDFNLTVTMDTNGILLNEKMAKQLVELEIDSIFVSIDAIEPETFEKVRGKDVLHLVEKNVLNLLKERGDKLLPRIGVSFVVEDNNRSEEELFVQKWKSLVDVIRVNKEFSPQRQVEGEVSPIRTPCWSLYDSIMVNYDGSVSLCCVDTHSEVEIGNAFDDGVLNLWNNGKVGEIRKLHEEGRFSEVGICANCNLWSNESPEIKKEEGFVIAKTYTHYFVNNEERLKSIPHGNRYIKA
ncbi:MAG: SPASM domain-containing protein [Bacteriovoracaceae bacterium]|nr:SPASM domain-containing protein [Bacteriovoracaceae bacterium]